MPMILGPVSGGMKPSFYFSGTIIFGTRSIDIDLSRLGGEPARTIDIVAKIAISTISIWHTRLGTTGMASTSHTYQRIIAIIASFEASMAKAMTFI
jgi:hypothetical protein